VKERKKIVLIEDQLILSKIMTHMIMKCTSYEVIQQADGLCVLDIVREKQPDLLVLDYNLPGMTGIEIYDLVHTTAGMEHIPALMVSAELPWREIIMRNIPGLSKPCRCEEFITAIEQIMSRQPIVC
jgi:CheY-like chemotaxis protein